MHGLHNQAMNGKEGTVVGSAVNNRIGIQLQGEKRQVSIKIFNLRYQEGPGYNQRTLYLKIVEKAQAEIELLSIELQKQIRITGNKHVETANARVCVGRALWLSNKPPETDQAVDEFQAAVLFMKQREPTHHSLAVFEKTRDMAQASAALFRTTGTLSAWPYWKPPTVRWEDKNEMMELFGELLAMEGKEKVGTITASTM